ITDISEYFLYKIDAELRDAFPDLDIVAKLADIREHDRIDALLRRYKPDVIFHAAALKHVPLLENNVIEGIKTNVLGSKNLADLAVAHKVKTFVQISTDKAVNPTNIMGTTKRAAEAYCQALDIQNGATRFKTVRFGNVLGSNGSVVPRFAAQIAKGGPVTVTHEAITRFFMTIPEAVRLVLQASGHGMARSSDRGRILVLDMGEPVKIIDL
ncbi:MAG: polysaccharide biosynthesis protein, partial [Ottowia sp.]|nr:polysaccharide biosynthesis protein [Ottowia sp.]